jgi:uncharacterized phage infection (PIP) family protein YhgE
MQNPIFTQKKELSRIKKLTGKYSEIVNLKNALETYKNNLETIKQQADSTINVIINSQAEAQKSLEGLKQIVNETSALKDTVVQINTQVETKRDNIIGLETKVTELSQRSVDNDKKYTDLNSEISKLKEEVKKQLAVATGGTLANSFVTRQKDLKFGSTLWLVFFILSSLALISAGIIIVEQIIRSNLSNSPISLIKVLITLPLFYIFRFFRACFES